MLRNQMFTRTRAFALALMLLFAQQFGVLHSLSHVRLQPAGVAVVATDSAAVKAATDPTVAELPADGLCQVCLLLAALGAAALPAGLQWLTARPGGLHGNRPAPPALQARPGAPYLARAPPRQFALT